jgi:hypothetical protein
MTIILSGFGEGVASQVGPELDPHPVDVIEKS